MYKRWALEEKKRLEDERGVDQHKLSPAAAVPAAYLPPTVTADPKQAAEAEERQRKTSEERTRIQRLQQEAEELIRRAKEAAGAASPQANGLAAAPPQANGPAAASPQANGPAAASLQANGPAAKSLQASSPDKDLISKNSHARDETKKPNETLEPDTKKTERREAARKILPPDPVVEKKITIELKSVKERNPTPTIRERIEEQKKREEERLRRLQEEKDKIRNLEKAVEDKLNAVRSVDKDSKLEVKEPTDKCAIKDAKAVEDSPSRSINGVEIINNSFALNSNGGSSTKPLSEDATDPLGQLPRWKREKMMRENRSLSTSESPPNASGSSSPLPACRKTSLGSPAASSLSLTMPCPALLAESEPDFARLPRWKREKILRERRQSQDQQVLAPLSPALIENDDIEKSSLLSTTRISPPKPLEAKETRADGDKQKGSICIDTTADEEASLPISTSGEAESSPTVPRSPPEPEELDSAPAPVKRRRNRRPDSEEVEEASQVSRPARRSRMEDLLAEVIIYSNRIACTLKGQCHKKSFQTETVGV